MTVPRYDVAALGPVFLDHILTGFAAWPQPGHEAFADSYQREAGGGCFNTVCGLAKLGCSTVAFAVVGDRDSDWLLQRVADFGVATHEIGRSQKPTGLTVSVSMPDNRSFFSYQGANLDLTQLLADPSLVERLATSRHVHFAVALPADPGLRIVKALRGKGCTVSLDVGWAPDWFSEEGSRELLRSIDLFLPNSAEAEVITGHKSWRQALACFEKMGLNTVALKMGGDGAALLSKGQYLRADPIVVKEVDTTGAGDAFNAGFLHAFLEGRPLALCLRRGVICGSLSVRKAGSLSSFPSTSEVVQFS